MGIHDDVFGPAGQAYIITKQEKEIEELRAELKKRAITHVQQVARRNELQEKIAELSAIVERLNNDYTEACQDATHESQLNHELKVEVEKYKAYFKAAKFENLEQLYAADEEHMVASGKETARRSNTWLTEIEQLTKRLKEKVLELHFVEGVCDRQSQDNRRLRDALADLITKLGKCDIH